MDLFLFMNIMAVIEEEVIKVSEVVSRIDSQSCDEINACLKEHHVNRDDSIRIIEKNIIVKETDDINADVLDLPIDKDATDITLIEEETIREDTQNVTPIEDEHIHKPINEDAKDITLIEEEIIREDTKDVTAIKEEHVNEPIDKYAKDVTSIVEELIHELIFVDKSDANPIVVEPIIELIFVDKSDANPIDVEPIHEPIVIGTTDANPIVVEPIHELIFVDKSDANPIDVEPIHEPIVIGTTDANPIVVEPIHEPIVVDTTDVNQIDVEPIIEPIVVDATDANPIIVEPVHEPIVVDTTDVNQIDVEPIIEPIVVDATDANPIIVEPIIEPIVVDATDPNPIIVEPVHEPIVVGTTDANPIDVKPIIEHIHGNLTPERDNGITKNIVEKIDKLMSAESIVADVFKKPFVLGTLIDATIDLMVYDGVISNDICDKLSDIIRLNMVNSTITSGSIDFRKSRTSVLDINNLLVYETNKHICEITGTDITKGEPIQGIHYDKGGYFSPHTDYFETSEIHLCDNAGNREMTSVLFLNDVKGTGGDLFFPLLNKTIEPSRGMIVSWKNMKKGHTLYASLNEVKKLMDCTETCLVKYTRQSTF